MEVRYSGFTFVSKYEQKHDQCPMSGFYGTIEEAEAKRRFMLGEVEIKRVTVIIEPLIK
jgi:hypothetical protein